jgi:hypothetical protein
MSKYHLLPSTATLLVPLRPPSTVWRNGTGYHSRILSGRINGPERSSSHATKPCTWPRCHRRSRWCRSAADFTDITPPLFTVPASTLRSMDCRRLGGLPGHDTGSGEA